MTFPGVPGYVDDFGIPENGSVEIRSLFSLAVKP
jgi:hypothetical protein